VSASSPLPIVFSEGFIMVMDDEESVLDMADGMLRERGPYTMR